MTRPSLSLSPLRVALQIAAAFLLLFAVAEPSLAAAAQTRPQPVPVALSEVKLINENAEESRFELAFDPTTTSFATIASQPNQPSIGFALATRRSQAAQPRGLKGLVRGIAFEQADTVLILHFATTQAASLSAIQTGPRTIEITVTTGKTMAAYGEQPAAAERAGGLPPGYEPLPGEEGYELVLLKYADVSEVVGLLTDGVTVKSNDNFIPSEPSFGSTVITGTIRRLRKMFVARSRTR